MEVKITTTIEKTLFGNSSENQNNVQKLQSMQIGGSTNKYETPIGYDITTELKNDFTIKDTQTFEFDLGKGNTFNRDILTLINTSVVDITFLHIYCVETTNVNELIPIKFKLSAEINAMGGVLELGEMTAFSMLNLKSTKFTKLFINDIVVPEDLKALLVVTLGSRNKNL